MDAKNALTDSDETLVARAKQDGEAFGCLYDRYVEWVYRFTYRRVKDHTIAEEITALVFHRALEQMPRFEWRGIPFGAWLTRIAANLIHDHRGQAQRQIPLHDWAEDGTGVSGSEPPVDEQCADRQVADALWQAVSSLPVLQQQVVVYRFVRDMSVRDIADAVGRTEGAVKQLLFRSMKRLRQQLHQIGFEPDGSTRPG
jgi:RNA polymerase sigma-70 factor (ECF subfamily)